MDDAGLQRVAGWAAHLPAADVRALAAAAAAGHLQQLRSASGSSTLRHACESLDADIAAGLHGTAVKGALLGALAMRHHMQAQTSIDVVWTGPTSFVQTGRLTSAVVTGLIGEAQEEILLIGYAVHTEQAVAQSLRSAAEAGVEVTLLLEHPDDNPKFTGYGSAFPEVPARRLRWPQDQRDAGGAALHAKVLVIDRRTALIGSANITGWALQRNLECGLLVRDRRVAQSIAAHVDGLVSSGQLQPSG